MSLRLGHETSADLERLRQRWEDQWEGALGAWSRYTMLSRPHWCLTEEQEKQEGLVDSFAMIRLTDHAVCISLRQIVANGLESFPREVLAHEIGHHVYAPANLTDNARLIARIRVGIPTQESKAGLVGNLYTDLLINDRLQRSAGLSMDGVYKKLRVPASTRLWTLYQRIYEILWSLPTGTLAPGKIDRQVEADAGLGARVIRAYRKDWLEGAGRFGALLLPYLQEMDTEKAVRVLIPWLDAQRAGDGGEAPDGLTEIDEDEVDGAIHPSEDRELTGLGLDDAERDTAPTSGGKAERGGKKNQYRSPAQYRELLQSVGVKLSESELVIRYYRERALPHLIRFPQREIRESTDPLPEGLDIWDVGSPLSDVDWVESIVRSPNVIPGVTTVQRTYGTTEGRQPQKEPVDLYLGVDCSGSMSNPAYVLSYPVLAGAIIVLSALRAGARVMATLSGEPGQYTSTPGFIRDEHEVLKVLTGYLGTGYSFGILRLKETFLDAVKPKRPVHILVVSDADIFSMLDSVPNGWDIAADALLTAGGGGTMVLQIPGSSWQKRVSALQERGWGVHKVTNWDEMIEFARAFSRKTYEMETAARG